MIKRLVRVARQFGRELRDWFETPILVEPARKPVRTWDRNITEALSAVPTGYLQPPVHRRAHRSFMPAQGYVDLPNRQVELVDATQVRHLPALAPVTEVTVITDDTVIHEGATEAWSPKDELDSVALMGHLDPEARSIHERLNEIEREFSSSLNDLMRVFATSLRMSPTDELVLAGVL